MRHNILFFYSVLNALIYFVFAALYQQAQFPTYYIKDNLFYLLILGVLSFQTTHFNLNQLSFIRYRNRTLALTKVVCIRIVRIMVLCSFTILIGLLVDYHYEYTRSFIHYFYAFFSLFVGIVQVHLYALIFSSKYKRGFMLIGFLLMVFLALNKGFILNPLTILSTTMRDTSYLPSISLIVYHCLSTAILMFLHCKVIVYDVN